MATSKSEDILGQKWDRCVADTLIKIGRPWPLIFGLGAGAGMGYANCQHEFDEPFLVKAEKIFVKPKIPAAPEASPTEAQ
ncbi:MICOS complex subunit Mic10-like [Homarus americanus]|uniref:MICOS complex subunit MIC10 n=1 Tax=Homarus americanus TaxID=6706 RepID=A0A8J5ND70_HOMAM|nr:MICOS complex subunit Mic10-like [Homarus americanus]